MLEFDGKRPIYLQLMEDLQNRIVAGELPPGSRLDSVRDLALVYGVNPNTLQRALNELERLELLKVQRTSGRFVTTDNGRIKELRKQMAAKHIDQLIQSLIRLGFGQEEILELVEKKLKELKTQ